MKSSQENAVGLIVVHRGELRRDVLGELSGARDNEQSPCDIYYALTIERLWRCSVALEPESEYFEGALRRHLKNKLIRYWAASTNFRSYPPTQPKWASASSGAIETTGTLRPQPVAAAMSRSDMPSSATA